MTAPAYTFKVDGVTKIPSRFHVKKTLSPNPWAFEADFPGLPSGISGGGVLDVYRDGYLYFKGKIIFCDPQFAPRIISVSGIDYTNYLLKTRNVLVRGEASDEPRNFIQNATAAAGVINGDQDAYGTSIPLRRDWNRCSEVIAKVTGMIGWQTLVHPTTNTLDFKSTVGRDKSASVTFQTGVNCIIAKKKDRRDQLFNRVYAKGKGASDENEILLPSPYYVEDAASIATYGLHVYPDLIERDIYTQAGLQTRANAFLAKHKDPWYVYEAKVTSIASGDLLDKFEVGDLVHFKADELGVDGNIRINSLDLTWTDEGEIITNELAQLGLAFEDLALQEKSYLLGLYGPQIFAKQSGVGVQSGSDSDSAGSGQDSDSAASSGPASSENTATGYNVTSQTVTVPSLSGAFLTIVRAYYWLTSGSITGAFYIQCLTCNKINTELKLTLDSSYVLILPGVFGGNHSGHTIHVQAPGTCSGIQVDAMNYGSHTHGITSPAHPHGITSPSHPHGVSDPLQIH